MSAAVIAAAAVIPPPSFLSAGAISVANTTFALPSTIVVADSKPLVMFGRRGVLMTTPPTGWTLKLDDATNNAVVIYRRPDGTETPGGTVTVPGGMVASVCVQYQDVIGSGDPFDFITAGNNASGVATTTLSGTTNVIDVLLAYLDITTATRTVTLNPTGLTLDTTDNQIIHHWSGPKAAAGATGNLAATLNSGSLHKDILCGFRPAV